MSQPVDSLSAVPSLLEGLTLKDSRESFRTRVLFKSIDAAMVAHLQPTVPASKLLKEIFNLHTANHQRVAAVVNLLNVLNPNTSIKVSQLLTNYKYLPFPIRDINPMWFGSGSSVFLLETEQGRFVMKVYRRSLGRTGKDLLELCDLFQRKFHTVSAFYNGQFQLVPPALFMVLHGPALGAPAAVMIQAYIPGEKKDLFLDYTNGELLAFFEQEPELKEQFIFFAQKTLEVYNQHGLCFDFIGRENLMMAKLGDRYQLFIIDYGIFNLEEIKASAPAHFIHIRGHLDRLKVILNLIDEKK